MPAISSAVLAEVPHGTRRYTTETGRHDASILECGFGGGALVSPAEREGTLW